MAIGNYSIETFDPEDRSISNSSFINWSGGIKTFITPGHVKSDWILYIKPVELFNN